MLKTRIITALASLVLIGIVLFVLPPLYAEWIIGALLIAGAWEWSGFLESSGSGIRLIYTALVAAALGLIRVEYEPLPTVDSAIEALRQRLA